MIEKLKNLIKIGIKKETKSASIASVDIAGTEKPVVMMLPYGMFANPGNDIFSLVMQDQGNEESLFAIVFDKKNLEELDDGEVALGIPVGDARIYFRKNGNITFKIGNTEGGDFAARFNELKSGFDTLKSDFNNLVTKYNTDMATITAAAAAAIAASGLWLTSLVIGGGTPSSASIDSAKIAQIEFPS